MDATVRKETGYIAIWVFLLSVLTQAVFLVIGKLKVTATPLKRLPKRTV